MLHLDGKEKAYVWTLSYEGHDDVESQAQDDERDYKADRQARQRGAQPPDVLNAFCLAFSLQLSHQLVIEQRGVATTPTCFAAPVPEGIPRARALRRNPGVTSG